MQNGKLKAVAGAVVGLSVLSGIAILLTSRSSAARPGGGIDFGDCLLGYVLAFLALFAALVLVTVNCLLNNRDYGELADCLLKVLLWFAGAEFALFVAFILCAFETLS